VGIYGQFKIARRRRKDPAERSPVGPFRTQARVLEYELPSKFDGSGIERSGDFPEVAVRRAVLHAVELRMVECIETLGAEFEAGAIAEVERLIERSSEVGAPRPDDDIAPRITKCRDWVHPARTVSARRTPS